MKNKFKKIKTIFFLISPIIAKILQVVVVKTPNRIPLEFFKKMHYFFSKNPPENLQKKSKNYTNSTGSSH